MKSKRSKSRRPKAPNGREFCVLSIRTGKPHEPILAGDHLIEDGALSPLETRASRVERLRAARNQAKAIEDAGRLAAHPA
jgi:hypothetical protein